jgi:hypothetical protein
MKPTDDLAATLKLVQSQASARYDFPREEPGTNNIIYNSNIKNLVK